MCKAVTNAFGMTPKMPEVPETPAAPPVQPAAETPSAASPEVAAAGDAVKAAAAKQRGRAATMLTGPRGLLESPPVSVATAGAGAAGARPATKALLGG